MAPGTSWRVGVIDPSPLPHHHSNLGAITHLHLATKTKAAAMTLCIKEKKAPEQLDDEASKSTNAAAPSFRKPLTRPVKRVIALPRRQSALSDRSAR